LSLSPVLQPSAFEMKLHSDWSLLRPATEVYLDQRGERSVPVLSQHHFIFHKSQYTMRTQLRRRDEAPLRPSGLTTFSSANHICIYIATAGTDRQNIDEIIELL